MSHRSSPARRTSALAAAAAAALAAAPPASPVAAQLPRGRAAAAAPRLRPLPDRLTLLGGLSQPLAFGGGNVEVQYATRRLALEYSHGWSLELSNVESGLRDADRAEGLLVRMPFSTGGGVGLRVSDRLHATLDAKVHRVEVSSPRGGSARYTAFTLGPAVGYTIPVWRGLVVQPVVRWWPNVDTSLDDERVALRRADGTRYAHRAITQGPGGFNANVKLGWRF